MKYKEIPYDRIETTALDLLFKVLPNTGLMKYPAVQSQNNLWLRDTTPMIDWFEKMYPQHSIFPSNPLDKFLSKLIEDYVDEWLWRPAMYYRWAFPLSYELNKRRIGQDVFRGLGIPTSIIGTYFAWRQKIMFIRRDGITKKNKKQIEKIYFDQLQALDNILARQPYLLGDRPTLVDFAYFGPMFRHFSIDPEPSKIMQEKYPRVYAWVAQLWYAKASTVHSGRIELQYDNVGWRYILNDICTNYLPYLHQNAISWQKNIKKFDFHQEELSYYSLPVIHYRVYCREALQNQFYALSNPIQQQIRNLLKDYGGIENLEKDGIILSGLAQLQESMPYKADRFKPRLLSYLGLAANGTPWDVPKRFLQN